MLLLLAIFPIKTDRGIKFSFFAPDAKVVFIAGDFNGWGRTPLEKNEEGFWETIIPLKPGRYEYKYIVDGEWVNDPDNPVVTGGYKNSVIIVSGSGNVLLPYSSTISFSGINRMMMNYEKDSLTDMDVDAIFDIHLFLSSVESWTRLRYSGSIYLNRAKATFGKEWAALGVFYNTYALKSDDPLHITGDIGKYRDSLGRNYSGLYLTDGKNMVYYTNSILDGSDIYGFRLKPSFLGYYIGFSGKIKDWYGYSSYDDTIKDTIPITYYLRKKEEHFGFDIGIKNLILEFDRQCEYNGVYKYSIEGEEGDTSLYTRLYKQQRIHLQYTMGSKRIFIRYADASFPEGVYYSSIQPGFGWMLKGINIKYSHLYFIKGEGTGWDYAFYHPYIQRLKASQYPCVGYREIGELKISAEKQWRFVKTGLNLLLTKPDILSEYFSLELNPYFRTSGQVGIGGDFRYVRYRWSELNTDFTAPFIYVFYKPFGSSEFRVSMGLDPYDLEDQKRARETYLESRGILLSSLKNYTNFTQLLEQAEKSLSDYRKIELRVTVRFP